MSRLQSESQNPSLDLTVRVKLTNLDDPKQGNASEQVSPESVGTADQVYDECLEAMVRKGDDPARSERSADRRPQREEQTPSLPSTDAHADNRADWCYRDKIRIAFKDFEDHIENCRTCNNRVELQLDFVECVEAAIYERKHEPYSNLIKGVMMVSAPGLNFAVCGELVLG